MQIQEIIKNVKLSDNNSFAAAIGIITLLLGATGVFVEIQDSLNLIWGLKAKPRRGLMVFIKHRLILFFNDRLYGVSAMCWVSNKFLN